MEARVSRREGVQPPGEGFLVIADNGVFSLF